MAETLRVGLIGAGDNTRQRHIPGLRALPDVELVAVCNRRPTSTDAVAEQFGIPRRYARWQDLIADADLDAIVIGTWPYLHAPITLAALQAGKHVLCEARMALNATEARQMHAAAEARPDLVAQLVPSPFGLAGGATMQRLLREGAIGELREVEATIRTGALADPAAPLSWRQDAALSGVNMLMLGIMQETLGRWLPPVTRVLAQATAFVPTRIDPACGTRRPVGTPDSVQVLAVLANGARVTYQMSGATPVGGGMRVSLFGTHGLLHYDFTTDTITLTKADGGPQAVAITPEEAGTWCVEADWVASIREGATVRLTDFATGVAYMEFTEAVARSAATGQAVNLPSVERDDG
jgi:predicted dehydrogenase